MKKTFFVLLMMFAMGNVAKAADLDINLEPLKLQTPVMEMKLDCQAAPDYRPELELPMSPLMGSSEKYQLTWMRTNPGVKPYKVMDDLTFAGIPLFVAGIIAKGEKKSFRQNTGDNRHTLVTDFKTEIDNYTQFFGPVMATGLKIAGVEGRSDWGRYLASTAMSYGFMALFVNSIKYTAKEMRPDGSTRNSWPSGHTATAFVGATILHKEYGLTRSPWYSVAGYGVATATGVMRVLNNRHWVSDVLSGAGVGIMSGELAYAMSDLIFKGKGLLRGDAISERSIIDHPSFFSISMGLGLGSQSLDFGAETMSDAHDNFNLKFGASTAVSAEGAYFFNKYVGVGGRLRVNSTPINGWDRVLNYADQDVKEMFKDLDADMDLRPLNNIVFRTADKQPQFTIESDHLTEFAADLGVYFNLPLSKRFAMGAKLLAGRSIMQELNLSAHYQGKVVDVNPMAILDDDPNFFYETDETYDTKWDYFTLNANNTFKWGTGISLTYAYKENYAWRLFVDYDMARKTYTLEYNPTQFMHSALPTYFDFAEMMQEIDPAYAADMISEMSPVNTHIKKNRHTFVIGGSLTISF
ncbi:PAP2 superfamily protein [Prevotella sp. khp1]|uniref:phosphatase PAP2 family protein n=1 Tax=Prevotellaceae TaxID=171552 RepID=UPI00088A8F31|nr:MULTISPECIES: phosphatase PAP2 family protein [Prevotellaceae]QVJ80338.1 phosphatase PAP2 family protein [Xylanibacter ruminicola]SDQ24014.1 PAP2 superfamily protein [Prevotella sp. khp1]